MKKFKCYISALLILFLISSVSVVPTSAAVMPYYPGDVDLIDSVVTIKDATLVQKQVAGLVSLNKKQVYLADVDSDDDITIKDATLIQKHVAGLIGDFDREPLSVNSIHTISFYSDYDSGKAMVGEPVTFTIQAGGSYAPFTYEFLIDGEVVQPRSTDNTLTYTFNKQGFYNIRVEIYDAYDFRVSSPGALWSSLYEVTNHYTVPAEDVYITQLVHIPSEGYGRGDIKILANAIGGSGEYEYRFEAGYSESGHEEILQDYSDKNYYILDESFLKNNGGFGGYSIYLYVRDKNNHDIVDQDNYSFRVYY